MQHQDMDKVEDADYGLFCFVHVVQDHFR